MRHPFDDPGLRRRDFLKHASAATLSALAAGAPRLASANVAPGAASKLAPTADCLIVLWMGGGMAHTETFDPKAHTPYEKGMDPNRVLSTFPAIDTVVDGMKISQGLENLAKVMDRATLIRTYQAGDLGFILHSRHQYHWHTGYAPPLTVAAPHLGSVIAKTLGPREPDLPAFINIGQRFEIGEGEEIKAFTTAGFLGSEYGPFNITYPEQAAAGVRPPGGMTPSRFENRAAAFRKLVDAGPVGREGSDYQRESLLRSLDNAHRLLTSPAAKAFDLDLEPEKSRAAYDTGRFGLGCLLARRLAEAGARFIEVTTEYEPFKQWDTHENGHTRLIDMKKAIDAPVARLVLDLEERGMLDRTLIVLASEFSRDMMLEGKPEKPVVDQVEVPRTIEDEKFYGMHRHFTGAGSVLCFGGGLKKGFVYGRTSDERPCVAVENPIGIEDLHASIYRAMGIPHDLAYVVEERPFYVTRDGVGRPAMELFA